MRQLKSMTDPPTHILSRVDTIDAGASKKDSHIDNGVSDVDDENGQEVESFFVHQREVEEQGDCQGHLGKRYLSGRYYHNEKRKTQNNDDSKGELGEQG